MKRGNEMKALIVYDSFYGNTLKVAEMFQRELKLKKVSVELVHVTKVDFDLFAQNDMLLFGSPTRGFRATQPMLLLLKNKNISYENKQSFVFDTRIDATDIKSKMLKKMMKSLGFASDNMEKILKKRGANLIMESEGYGVISSEGPLKPEVAYQVELAVARMLEILKK